MDETSIFTKIINGDIPSHTLYEDQYTYVFLDINPLLPGHVLVVSKQQVDHVDDLPPADYSALFETVRRTMKRVKEVMGTKRAIMMVMGYDVPHAHVHVMPCDSAEKFYEAMNRAPAASNKPEPDHTTLTEIATRLKF